MAHRLIKNEAIGLRKKGLSYSQIKEQINVSKSTLSTWLRDLPLPEARLRELRDFNQVRIEKTRATKSRRRASRLSEVADNVSKEIGKITNRELFIAGFFLYWAEGGKTTTHTITLSNTDPRMIRAYLKWLFLIKAPMKRMYIKLHLYMDMNEPNEVAYWSKELNLPKANFKKSYIKSSKLSELTHITKGHGTCNIVVSGRDISEYVLIGQRKVSELF